MKGLDCWLDAGKDCVIFYPAGQLPGYLYGFRLYLDPGAVALLDPFRWNYDGRLGGFRVWYNLRLAGYQVCSPDGGGCVNLYHVRLRPFPVDLGASKSTNQENGQECNGDI